MTEFSRNQKKALAALLTSTTVDAAAEVAGVSHTTIFGYLREPEFKTALRTRQDAAVAGVVAGLSALAGTAVDVLGNAMLDQDAPAATRVRAALGCLEHLVRLTNLRDLEDRIAALEEAAAL